MAAWFISENGWHWPVTNNPGNISWSGKGTPPQQGIWTGVRAVLPNKVVEYETPEQGLDAFCALLSAPATHHGGHKALTIDVEDIKAALTHGIEAACKVIGQSNWAEGHYDDGRGPGSLILDVYHSPQMETWFGQAKTISQPQGTPPAAGRTVHIVQPGETLSGIGLRYQVPWPVLARYNRLSNPDLIHPGDRIVIPIRYTIRPGDTLSQIAAKYGEDYHFLADVNQVNPDRILAWHVLFV
ncbi:MAG: LysM peptidoglycan-binding domain-containing protein [Acidobacterium ailaaui]|nr:LysM peptidoglycan-binding domain-containing protein [Pseudacidobacterium ailaaui]